MCHKLLKVVKIQDLGSLDVNFLKGALSRFPHWTSKELAADFHDEIIRRPSSVQKLMNQLLVSILLSESRVAFLLGTNYMTINRKM